MTHDRKEKMTEVKNKGPYFQAYDKLKSDLSLLRELNRQLPRSINGIRDEREKELVDKATKLGKKSSAEFQKFANVLGEIVKWEKNKKSGSVSLSVSDKTRKFAVKLLDVTGLWWGFNRFIRDMSLVYLIAEFESFLQSILKISFQKNLKFLGPLKRV